MSAVSLHNCFSICSWLEMMHVVDLIFTMHLDMSIKMLRTYRQMSRIVSQKLWFQNLVYLWLLCQRKVPSAITSENWEEKSTK